jgi:hypothetical protein
MRDTGRLVYTLTRMNDVEADQFNIPLPEQRLYLRLDNAKVNTAPPARDAEWFRLVGVKLGNGTELYPGGDEVQTVEPWWPPELWEGVTDDAIGVIVKALGAGLENGQRYSNAPAASARAACSVVRAHCPDKNDKQCREMVSAWVKNGLLEEKKYDDPVQFKELKGLFPGKKKWVPQNEIPF